MNKILSIIAFFLASLFVGVSHATEQTLITAHTDQVFLVERDSLDDLPKWNISDGELPVSPVLATKIGAKALKTSPENIVEITLSNSGNIHLWFYMLTFFDKDAMSNIVVLLNGKAVLGETVSESEFQKIWKNRGRNF